MLTPDHEPRDELDDHLDSMLASADADLRGALTDVLSRPFGLYAIVSAPSRTEKRTNPEAASNPPVADQIVRLRTKIRQLRKMLADNSDAVEWCLEQLHELQENLEHRRLSRDQADLDIEAVRDRLEQLLEANWHTPPGQWVETALENLDRLQVSVLRLFEESNDFASRG